MPTTALSVTKNYNVAAYDAFLDAREFLNESTFLLTFALQKDFYFTAGQYARITLQSMPGAEERDTWREFSIASSPSTARQLSIATRISPSRFKQYVLQAPLGTKVQIEGPFGYFTLPQATKEPIVFIAGGMGITPFLSMITDCTERALPAKLQLLYNNRSLDSAVFVPELHDLAHRNKNFAWQHFFGPLHHTDITSAVANPASCIWYVAGPPLMVQATRQLLLHVGVSEKNINVEEFTGY